MYICDSSGTFSMRVLYILVVAVTVWEFYVVGYDF